jgi:hypothetical protein
MPQEDKNQNGKRHTEMKLTRKKAQQVTKGSRRNLADEIFFKIRTSPG